VPGRQSRQHVRDTARDAPGVEFAERLLDGHRLVGVDMVPLVPHLRPGSNHQALPFRLLPGGDHATTAGRIDGHGLLDEGVLARLDSGLKVQRAKQRRRGHQHNLNVRLQQGLIAGRAAEAPAERHAQLLARLNGARSEVVGGRHDADVKAEDPAGFESPGSGTATALPARARTVGALKATPAPKAVCTKSRRDSLVWSFIGQSL